MTKIITYTLSILLLLAAFSCKKKAAEVNPDYIGYWTGSDSEKSYSLEIQSSSKAVYNRYKDFSTVEVKGRAKIKGNTLKVLTKKFTIDQEPRQDALNPGTYTMILDGIMFSATK